MGNKFKSAHRCNTPTLMMRRVGSRWTCKGEGGCGSTWMVVESERRTILGRMVKDRYWLMVRG